MKKIKLGFAPTRRSIFSAPDAVKYRGLTAQRLKELGVDFVDITDINEEGLLYDDKDVDKIVEKFKKEGVDGLMLPHCNFGTEYVCARLAKKLDVPVLLWGPLDERPEPNGVRLRDTQCGLFATGKVLRRFQIPFTYLTNCRLNDPVFERGVKDFLAVCNVVKTFKNIRILQISTRPFDFWTTMCNEGELLEKFNIQLAPVPMTELTEEVKTVREDKEKMEQMIAYIKDTMVIKIKEEEVEMVAALALAMKSLVEKYGCQAAAIQCWNALQTEIGIMPCAANAILNEQGIPVVCETDIHGAVTALLAEAAGIFCRLDDPPSGHCKRRTAAALRTMADVCCTGKTGTDVSAGIRASGKSDCRSKTRRSDTVPLRWRQWRIFTSSWKRKRCGRTERNGNISLGRSGKHQTSGSQDCRRTVYSPLCRYSQQCSSGTV